MTGQYPVVIFAHLDTTQFKDAESYFINYKGSQPILNPLFCSQTLLVTQNFVNSGCKISISSNGIDGNGYSISTFDIDKNKFCNSKVFFVARIKTAGDVPVKNLPLLPLSSISVSIIDTSNTPITGVTFYDNFDVLSGDTGGFFKGYFVGTASAADVRISISCNISGVNLSGYSNSFSIYPSKGIYDIRKINEDNDQEAQFQSLAFQQILQDKTSLFRDFIGQIVGNYNSDPNTLGIKIYEKISNFVSNNTDIVYSNLPEFISMLQITNNTFEKYNIQFPPSLQRLVDIFSIPLSNQIGNRNKYNTNFDSKGYESSKVYGVNKGNKIDFDTGVLYNTINLNYYTQVVVHEKFSNQYTLVNSLIPDDASVVYIDTVNNSYALSAYKPSWGWGLVLPQDIQNIDIPKYYDFYEYTNAVDNTLLQKFIDFDNKNNTYLVGCSSYDQYANDGGIIDNTLTHLLYTSVGIIST